MQSSIMTTWVCLLALMLTSQPCHGDSVLTFTATPKAIKQNLTRHVTLRCEAAVNQARSGSTDEDIERVVSYWVTYGDDEYVASVDTNEKAKGFIDEGILRVSGSVSGMGFLELTWVSPSTMRLGTYKCHVNAKSKMNRFVQLKKSLQLTSEEPSMVDLLKRINQNEQDRKDEVKQLKEADKKQLERINQNEQDRKDEVKQLKEADKKQSQQFDNLTNSVTGVKQCTSSRVAFTAGLSSSGRVYSQSIVVYDKQIYNLGNAYSTATGRFTCPVAGLYAFMVNVMSEAATNFACLKLRRNLVDVSRTYVRDNNHPATGSISATLHLDVGDTVDLVPSCSSSFMYTSSTPYNTFSGMLLSADTCM